MNKVARSFKSAAISAVKSMSKGNKKAKNSSMTLSPCALKYAQAISQPFSPLARGACIPCYPSAPSQKVTTFSRFTMTAGTGGGVFFCYIQPCIASDGVVAFHSIGGALTNAGVPATLLTATNTLAAGIATASPSNCPYSSAELTTGIGSNFASVTGRVVTLGVRVSYIGTTLNEGGVYYTYTSPFHENVLGIANTASTFGSLADAQVLEITRNPIELTVFPVNSLETSYPDQSAATTFSNAVYPYSGGITNLNPAGTAFSYLQAGVNVGAPPLAIYGTTTAGNTFMVEIVQHIEYTGPLTSAAQTPTHADQRGFELVDSAASRLPLMKQNSPKTSYGTLMMKALGSVIKESAPVAISALGMLI